MTHLSLSHGQMSNQEDLAGVMSSQIDECIFHLLFLICFGLAPFVPVDFGWLHSILSPARFWLAVHELVLSDINIDC